MKRVLSLFVLVASVAGSALIVSAQGQAPYRRPPGQSTSGLPICSSRMTLEEKAAQLIGVWNNKGAIQDAERPVHARRPPRRCSARDSGQISRPSEIAGTPTGPRVRSPRQEAEFTNAIQKWVKGNTRLGIPVMFHEEALHGLVAPGRRCFPCRWRWRARGIRPCSSA